MTNYFPTISDNHANTILEATSTGLYLPFAANVQVKTNNGMQTVPSRTNAIRNNSTTGIAIGTPGTLPTNTNIYNPQSIGTQIVGFGVENGLPYWDYRLFGSPAAGSINIFFDTATNPSATAAVSNVWTSSAFVKLIGGSTANITAFGLVCQENAAGGAYLSDTNISLFTNLATGSRTSVTRTFNQATVAFAECGMFLTWPGGAAIDITLRIYAPQLELGAFASPPILTTSSAVTVPGNIQNYDFTGKLANGFTGYIKLNALGLAGLTNPRIISFNDGTFANRFIIYYNGTALAYSTVISNASIVGDSTNNPTTTGQQIVVFACGPSYQNARIVGKGATTPLTGSYPSGLTKLTIGGEAPDTSENIFQYAQKIVLKFGAPSQATFDAMYNLAQLDTSLWNWC